MNKYRRNASVISQHETIDAMSRLEIGRLLGQKTLYGRRAPRYELTQFSLANSQQTLVHLRRVDLALDYVEN